MTATQPAKKSYFFEKGYIDLGNTIKGAWSRNSDSIKKYISNLQDLGDKSLIPRIFLAVINIIAVLAVIIFGSLITAVITAVNIVILLAFMAIVYIGFSIIWGIDRLYLVRNKIFTACHECKEKSLIPTYICPNCGAKHTNLTPGVYGILHRTCNCGENCRQHFLMDGNFWQQSVRIVDTLFLTERAADLYSGSWRKIGRKDSIYNSVFKRIY